MTGGTVYARCDLGGGVCDAIESSTALGPGDWQHLESLLSEHWKRTGSAAAAALLGRGAAAAAVFRKFSPAEAVVERASNSREIDNRDLTPADMSAQAVNDSGHVGL
jgi:glutamate synthase domain-containing protein 3